MVRIKTPQEIKILEEGGKHLASILNCLAEKTAVGASAWELDELAFNLIKKLGGEPAFLNYRPQGNKRKFPFSLCVSVNDEIVHGLPLKEKIFKEGDIVSLDLGLKYKNLFTDMALTVEIGQVARGARKLIETARKALENGIVEIKEGARLGDYGFAVQSFVESRGFSVARELVGHGVGYAPHEEPDISNWGRRGVGLAMKIGMVFALETMVCEGGGAIMLGQDGWAWKAKDGLLSAHFEHTVAVEKSGCRILTNL